MKNEFNCPNCGAPITGDRCSYCGTQLIDCTTIRTNKPFYLKYSPDGINVFVSKVFIENFTCEIGSEVIGGDGRDVYGRITPMKTVSTQKFTATYVSVR